MVSPTSTQNEALERLKAVDLSTLPRTAQGNLKTGINTTVLHNLRELGLISCSHIYLRGIVSADLSIIPEEPEPCSTCEMVECVCLPNGSLPPGWRKGKLTRTERLQAMADYGIDTREEYEDYR